MGIHKKNDKDEFFEFSIYVSSSIDTILDLFRENLGADSISTMTHKAYQHS